MPPSRGHGHPTCLHVWGHASGGILRTNRIDGAPNTEPQYLACHPGKGNRQKIFVGLPEPCLNLSRNQRHLVENDLAHFSAKGPAKSPFRKSPKPKRDVFIPEGCKPLARGRGAPATNTPGWRASNICTERGRPGCVGRRSSRVPGGDSGFISVASSRPNRRDARLPRQPGRPIPFN